MRLAITDVEQKITGILGGLGYSKTEAEAIKDVLMYAQLRGSSRGVAELFKTGMVPKREDANVVIQKETPVSAYIHARGTHAMLVVSQGMHCAIQKARSSGVGMVTVNHTSAASGALGYYPYSIASAGFVGIVMATTPPMVAPAGTSEPILGANPIAIAVPTNTEPLVLDMDTAALAFPGAQALASAGKDLAKGIAYDKTGHPTTDPLAALQGAMRPFGGYKGSHLSLMIQLLAGPLAGSGRGIDNQRGHLLLAVDPDIFGGASMLRQESTELLATIKRAKKLENVEEIVLPGEYEDRIKNEALRTGMMEIDDSLYQRLEVQ